MEQVRFWGQRGGSGARAESIGKESERASERARAREREREREESVLFRAGFGCRACAMALLATGETTRLVARQGERASEREREDRALFRLEAGCLLCPTGPLCVARETGARKVFYLLRTPVACVTAWPATTLFSLLYILNQPFTSFCCFFRED